MTGSRRRCGDTRAGFARSPRARSAFHGAGDGRGQGRLPSGGFPALRGVRQRFRTWSGGGRGAEQCLSGGRRDAPWRPEADEMGEAARVFRVRAVARQPAINGFRGDSGGVGDVFREDDGDAAKPGGLGGSSRHGDGFAKRNAPGVEPGAVWRQPARSAREAATRISSRTALQRRRTWSDASPAARAAVVASTLIRIPNGKPAAMVSAEITDTVNVRATGSPGGSSVSVPSLRLCLPIRRGPPAVCFGSRWRAAAFTLRASF